MYERLLAPPQNQPIKEPSMSLTDTDQALTLLAREIKSGESAVYNAITNRREHPSYGYTKKSINDRYQRVVGLAGAYLLLSGQALHTECVHGTIADVNFDVLAVAVRAVK